MSQFISTERKQIRSIIADYILDNPSGATPSSTVADETTAGLSSSAGVATTYSRGDHTHGTPSAASHTHPESDVTNLVSDLAAKQAVLVSGTTIKTVNSLTLLGSGNIDTTPSLLRSFVLMGS